jgi:hypothetical protein
MAFESLFENDLHANIDLEIFYQTVLSFSTGAMALKGGIEAIAFSQGILIFRFELR